MSSKKGKKPPSKKLLSSKAEIVPPKPPRERAQSAIESLKVSSDLVKDVLVKGIKDYIMI